jgi:DNA-binding transcriptional LysR family regulator
MLDFRIETFLEVCNTLNYTHAAQKLNITQPAVSQHIHFLEEEYQIKLFDYRGRKLSLTTGGEMLKKLAATMMHDDHELKKRIIQLDIPSRSLNIGVTRTAGEYVLAPLLAIYLNTHPTTQLNVIENDTRALLSQLDEGAIDCALIEGFFDRNCYGWQIFSHESFVCVCASVHSFSIEPRKLTDLLGECLIIREEGSGTRAILEHLLESKNLGLGDFAHKCTVNSLNIIKQFVIADCGISFLYRSAVSKALAAESMREIMLLDADYSHDLTFVWRKESSYAEDYQNFIEELMSYRRAGSIF